MKREEIIEILKQTKDEAQKRYKARIKGIFGSYVRGKEHSGSDVDVFVEFESDADLIHFVGLSLFLEEKLGIKVDVVPYDTIRAEIKESILKEAVYL
jgi:predicted nucleotidyltransferase